MDDWSEPEMKLWTGESRSYGSDHAVGRLSLDAFTLKRPTSCRL